MYVLRLDGDKTDLENGLDSFARQHGWREETPDPKGSGKMIPNPMTKEDAALAALMNFIGNSIAGYNQTAARQKTDQAMAGIKATLTVE